MMQFTEEQRAELIEFNCVIIAQNETYAVPESGWPNEVRLMVSSARIALAALTANAAGKFVFEPLEGRYHHIKHGEPKHTEPKLPMVRLYTAPPATAPAVPDGWKLVPVIAFPLQWAAGQKAFDSAGMNKVDAVYKAMVTAAPEGVRYKR